MPVPICSTFPDQQNVACTYACRSFGLVNCSTDFFPPSFGFNLQQDQFGMYALYSKNKPKSDSLLASHGNSFFRVSDPNSCTRRCLMDSVHFWLISLYWEERDDEGLKAVVWAEFIANYFNLKNTFYNPRERFSVYCSYRGSWVMIANSQIRLSKIGRSLWVKWKTYSFLCHSQQP